MITRRAFIAAGAVALLPVTLAFQGAASGLARVSAASEEAGRKSSSHVDMGAFPESARTFSTNLPILVIDTSGQEVTQDTRARVTFQLIGDDYEDAAYDGTRNTLLDEVGVDCFADMNIRGHSSADLAKKSYRITLYKDADGSDEWNKSLLGMASDADWVLYGPYHDLSLIRNLFTYGIARECMEWAPDARWVELWLNGEYNGLYALVEKIQIDDNRIQATGYSTLSGDASFLAAREIPGSNENEFSSYVNHLGFVSQTMGILWPKRESITKPQQRFVEDYINTFERSLYGGWYLDDDAGYRSYIDLDSWATYYVLEEFSANDDTGYHSTYCYRVTGGKLKAGPVWDFNSAYNNYVGREHSAKGFHVEDNTYFDRMCTDPAFVDAVVEKYRELRAGVLSEESMLRRAAVLREQIAETIPRNDEVWAHYGLRTGLVGDDRKYADYDEAYEQFTGFIVERGAWLDQHIDELFLLCGYNDAYGVLR